MNFTVSHTVVLRPATGDDLCVCIYCPCHSVFSSGFAPKTNFKSMLYSVAQLFCCVLKPCSHYILARAHQWLNKPLVLIGMSLVDMVTVIHSPHLQCINVHVHFTQCDKKYPTRFHTKFFQISTFA